MSHYIFQIITKQWDKSELSEQHIAERSQLADRLPLSREGSVFALDQQCIIDRQGDNVMASQVQIAQVGADTIQVDRFQVSLSNASVEFIGLVDAELEPCQFGSLDEHFIQCQYEWRQRVFEGGYYYWLYERVIVNAIKVSELDENVFVNKRPEVFILNS